MQQSRSRRLLLLQARVIRIQWAIIFALITTVILMAIFMPKAEAQTIDDAPISPSIVAVAPIEEVEAVNDTHIIVEPELELLGEFRLTAYCACRKCCGKDPSDPGYGVTASGAIVEASRTIAVDSSIIPLGSEVVINGNTYTAEDTGSAIKGNRIDIYFETHQEALNFGVQYADVYIIKN